MLLNLQIDFYHSLQMSSGINRTPCPKKPQRDILRQGKARKKKKNTHLVVWNFICKSCHRSVFGLSHKSKWIKLSCPTGSGGSKMNQRTWQRAYTWPNTELMDGTLRALICYFGIWQDNSSIEDVFMDSITLRVGDGSQIRF